MSEYRASGAIRIGFALLFFLLAGLSAWFVVHLGGWSAVDPVIATGKIAVQIMSGLAALILGVVGLIQLKP